MKLTRLVPNPTGDGDSVGSFLMTNFLKKAAKHAHSEGQGEEGMAAHLSLTFLISLVIFVMSL